MTVMSRRDRQIILARRREILLKLQCISDALAGRAPDPNTVTVAKGTLGSSPPAEVHLERIPASNVAPPKNRSLFAHYEWQFARLDREIKAATTPADQIRGWMRMDLMCSKALRDYLIDQGIFQRPTADTDAENVRRVLSEYPGVPAEEVAVWEMCDPQWVRRVRRTAGLTELGEERPIDERTQRVLDLKRRGLPQKVIAQQIGVNQSTVSRILAAA